MPGAGVGGYITYPITAEDAASGFMCGQPDLDRFFAQHAVGNQQTGIGTSFVLRGTEDGGPRVLGFYTLSMADVASKQLRKSLKAKLPRYPLPVALIGRLGVHQDAQGQGVGQRLLGDALRRVHTAAALVGCVGVIVDAKDEAAQRFYERYGFTVIVSSDWPHRLFLPMGTIAAGLGT